MAFSWSGWCEAGLGDEAQAGVALHILQSQLPKCWDYRQALPRPDASV